MKVSFLSHSLEQPTFMSSAFLCWPPMWALLKQLHRLTGDEGSSRAATWQRVDVCHVIVKGVEESDYRVLCLARVFNAPDVHWRPVLVWGSERIETLQELSLLRARFDLRLAPRCPRSLVTVNRANWECANVFSLTQKDYDVSRCTMAPIHNSMARSAAALARIGVSHVSHVSLS